MTIYTHDHIVACVELMLHVQINYCIPDHTVLLFSHSMNAKSELFIVPINCLMMLEGPAAEFRYLCILACQLLEWVTLMSACINGGCISVLEYFCCCWFTTSLII